VFAAKVAPFGNVELDKKIKGVCDRHGSIGYLYIVLYAFFTSISINNMAGPHMQCHTVLPYGFGSLPDRQLQLFQAFHLRHTLPGFSIAFFRPSHKAASFMSILSLAGLFIPHHLPST
jgi:hypothetical protein